MYLFIKGESNPRYDQKVLIITKKHGIDTTCVHTAEDVFKKIKNNSNLQDETKFLHHAIQIFKGSLIHATWIHDIRMNVQEKFSIKNVQMSCSPELHTCEYEELKQRGK